MIIILLSLNIYLNNFEVKFLIHTSPTIAYDGINILRYLFRKKKQ